MLKIIRCVKKSIISLIDNHGVEHAGYMAFMLFLSLFPAITIFLSITHILGKPEIGTDFLTIIYLHLPSDTIVPIKEQIKNLISTPPQGLVTISLISYIWTSSSFLEGLRTILNKIYKVKSPPKYLLRRLMSLIQFIIIILNTFLLTLILFFLPRIYKMLPSAFLQIINKNLWYTFKYILTLTILFAVTSTLYFAIPNKKIKFYHVFPGALITVLLWAFTTRIYLKYFVYYTKISLVYGSLGNIVLTLILFYILNLAFIYGAEFNNAFFLKH